MRLIPWEEDRLLIFTAAELARRHRDRGILLSHPEAVALICDAMLEAAREGASYEAVEAAGRSAVTPSDLLDGVAALVDEVRLEVLFGDGPRLVVLVDPFGGAGRPGAPGEVRAAPDKTGGQADRDRLTLAVRNESRRVVRVSSHFPFERVNPRLVFDRLAATGFHLDLPPGSSERWSPGQTRTIALVRFGGAAGRDEGASG